MQPAEHFVIALPLPGLPADPPSKDAAWPQLGRIHPAEIGKVVVQPEAPLPAGSALMLRVDKAAIGRVSLFQKRKGQWTLRGADGTWKVDWELVGRPHAELGVVAHSFAQADWSGEFTLTVALVAGDGPECGTSEVRFRVAPFLLASALDPVEEVLVVESPRTAGFAKTLERILQQIGVPLRTIRVAADQDEYDLWPQDALEIGRICVPSRQGVRQVVAVLTGMRARLEEWFRERENIEYHRCAKNA